MELVVKKVKEDESKFDSIPLKQLDEKEMQKMIGLSDKQIEMMRPGLIMEVDNPHNFSNAMAYIDYGKNMMLIRFFKLIEYTETKYKLMLDTSILLVNEKFDGRKYKDTVFSCASLNGVEGLLAFIEYVIEAKIPKELNDGNTKKFII